jgi:hypothetical protein
MPNLFQEVKIIILYLVRKKICTIASFLLQNQLCIDSSNAYKPATTKIIG